MSPRRRWSSSDGYPRRCQRYDVRVLPALGGVLIHPMADDRWYALWTWGMATVVLSAGGILPLSGAIPIERGAALSALAGAVGLTLLLSHGIGQVRRRGYALPNVLTASRGVAGAALLTALAGALPAAALTDRSSLFVFGVLALVEVTDFFDGRVARTLGASRFGGVWDMETDAFFTFALGYAVWGYFSFPVTALAIGWMRYLYFVVTRFQGDPPECPRSYKLFAKSVAATLVIVLIGAFLVVLPRRLRVTALWIALVLQVVSFGWDFALQLRNRRMPPRADA